MVVRQQFLFNGEIRRPGEPFSCDSAMRMRQLYEQRKIQPSVSVGEAMQQAKPTTVQEEMRHPVREVHRTPESPAKSDAHSQGRKKHGS